MDEVVPLDFWLSGSLRMRTSTDITVLKPNRQHELLALLLLHARRAVPISELAGSVWPGSPPTDDEFIRPYMSRLRSMLRNAGAGLDCVGGRYCLDVDPMRVDVLRFDVFMTEADRTDDPDDQRRLVDAALDACPTGNLLTDFTRTWAHTARAAHQAKWNAAALRRNRYWLRAGLHDQLLSVLRREEIHRSTNQRWAEDYLIALYRTGLVLDALAHYEALERHLQQTGVTVSERLQGVADAIRREDPVLDDDARRSATPVPDTLPPPRGPLAGRYSEVKAVRAHADAGRHDAVRVVGLYGPPGIGKTALALAYAHAHKARYPGGTLYADFGAFGPGARIDSDTVLVSFLDALGVSNTLLPPDRARRVARYRDVIRRRPMLVVLDNVAASRDIEDLLPTAPGSLAIVTSRNRLTALTSRHQALPVVLGPIKPADAMTLLSRLIGHRPDGHDSLTAAIARACAGHPLALCLAGARIATRPEESLADIAAALADPTRRLAALDRYAESGDRVAEVFGWSYQTLTAPCRQVFRALGQSPCPSLDLPAAAELTGLRPDALAPVLADLVAAHLVEPVGADRYRMLDLLADYAVALSGSLDDADERSTALDRLYAFQRMQARMAAYRLWPADVLPLPEGDLTASIERFTDAASARRWLEDHRTDLLAAARHDAASERPRHLLELSAYLFRYLDHGGYLDDATGLHGAAVAAARRLDDEAERAGALVRLGSVLVRRGRPDDAESALTQANAVFARLGDRRGQAIAAGNLGRVAARRGAYADAVAHQTTALELFRAAGDQLGEARTLTNLGIVHEARDDLAEALRSHRAAHLLSEKVAAPDAAARALGSMAGVYRRMGHLDESARSYDEALHQFRALGDRVGEATTLTNLGLVRATQGRHDDAVRLHELALDLFEEIGDRVNVIETLNNLGSALLAAGRPTAAANRHHQALVGAEQSLNRAESARAHAGLATAYMIEGDRTADSARSTAIDSARSHYRQATDRYAELGVSEPTEMASVAEWLANT